MAIKKLNPYLNFNGNAAQALELYERALGAKVERVVRFGDVDELKAPPEQKNRVMHAVLRLGDYELMLCDTMQSEASIPGNNVHIVLDFDDLDEMTRKFGALAASGKVTMPINDTFWGAKFGMLDDAVGIRWMFNHETKKG